MSNNQGEFYNHQGGYMGGTPDGQIFGTQTPQYQQQQQQQRQQGMMQQPPGTPESAYQQQQQYPPQGSITRFASPPQQQQGTALFPPGSPYDFAPPPQPTPSGGSGVGFAQRSAMMQNQSPGYGPAHGQQQGPPPQQQQMMYGQPQQQQQQPPLQQPRPPVPTGPTPSVATGGMSFAQRSQMMQHHQPHNNVYGGGGAKSNVYGGGGSVVSSGGPPQQQQQQPPNNNVYGGGGNMSQQQQSQYQQPQPPSFPQPQYNQQQQQQQPQMQNPVTPQQQHGMAPQYGTPQQQLQQQQPGMMGQQQYQQPGMMGQQQQQQQPGMANSAMGGSSYAGRSVMAHSASGMPSQQQTMQAPQQQQQQGGMMPPHQQQQQQQHQNIYIDPPEVVAKQARLLTDATRKVQEHAYYMKQAMERNDLPTVLDRAASMVGELGEHAHAHHHHHSHPPAPGATGSTTALSPKNYYELHLRALEELPVLEDYLLNIAQQQPQQQQQPQGDISMMAQMAGGPLQLGGGPTNVSSGGFGGTATNPNATLSYTMKELYDCVQYCPNVLSRLYLQVCAASALIRSGQVGARWVLKDMIEAVKCVQNPVRGLFLRHYLLQAFRDKFPTAPIATEDIGPPVVARTEIPSDSASAVAPSPVIAADVTSVEAGNVKDSYEFILANFIEMNKLWVRIQHLPGDGRSKEIRRRREKDRNELRVLVGTNLVRLAALDDAITSTIYGQVILPTVLDHIVISGDPLAQAYLIDCITQVFPDEYHIETMPILLGVCPKLRDKVNIRTILQSLMDRLANYLADEELLDEKDSNQVKRNLVQDSFRMFDECVQNVFNARGPKLQAKEAIRLQTALLNYTMKCYQGNLDQVNLCLDHCVAALHQISANQAYLAGGYNDPQQMQNPPRITLDEVATQELEKLLSIPLDQLALGVLNLTSYAELISFLPWNNRRQVALTLLEAVSNQGTSPKSVKEIEELFTVIAPVLREETDLPPSVAIPIESTGPSTDATSRTTALMANLGVSAQQPSFHQGASFQEADLSRQYAHDAAVVSKLIHLLDHSDTDILYEMLSVARNHLSSGRRNRTNMSYQALVIASLKLVTRILKEQDGPEEEEEPPKGEEKPQPASESDKPKEESNEGVEETKVETVDDDDDKPTGAEPEEDKADEPKPEESPPAAVSEPPKPKDVTCRKVFVFIQQSIAALAKGSPEVAIKLYLECALAADKFGTRGGETSVDKESFSPIAYELVTQAFALYEENSGDHKLQSRCVVASIGTLMSCRSLSKEDYERLIMKTAQYAAKMLKKPDQCEMVALCSYLFYVVDENDNVVYANPQRGLECLQRALKLADACTNTNPANIHLFVDLLEHYLFFFHKKNPSINANYISGLVALIKEHTENLSKFGGMDTSSVGEAKAHFLHVVRHIKRLKEKDETKEQYAGIDISSISI